MDMIRYGVIGCGMMGHEHMRNIALLDGAEVVAFFEPDAGMAAAAAAIAPDAVREPTLDALLARRDLQALVIASPNDCHVDQFEAVAKTNPLPLLIEKPLFTALEDVARLRAIEESYPAPVWVAMEYRYMPAIAKLVEQAEAVTGGVRMLSIREHRFPFLQKVGGWNRFNVRTGGTLVEKCCHFFDLMRLILKSEPVRVMASGGQDVNHLGERLDGVVPDIWDNAYVIVDFANGARAMLELCMFAEGSEFQEEICAVGPEGKIEARVPGPGRFWPEDLGPAPVAQMVLSPRNPKRPETVVVPVDPTLLAAGDHNGATFYQHQRFLQAVRGQGPVEVGLNDGLAAVALGLAAERAARGGVAERMSLEETPGRPVVVPA
jgi:predicted dehydrogenase